MAEGNRCSTLRHGWPGVSVVTQLVRHLVCVSLTFRLVMRALLCRASVCFGCLSCHLCISLLPSPFSPLLSPCRRLVIPNQFEIVAFTQASTLALILCKSYLALHEVSEFTNPRGLHAWRADLGRSWRPLIPMILARSIQSRKYNCRIRPVFPGRARSGPVALSCAAHLPCLCHHLVSHYYLYVC